MVRGNIELWLSRCRRTEPQRYECKYRMHERARMSSVLLQSFDGRESGLYCLWL